MSRIGKKLQTALNETARSSRRRIFLSSGQALKLARESLSLTQEQLSKLTGVKQATISALENDREALGLERARVFAKALQVHPAVIAFPDWENEQAA